MKTVFDERERTDPAPARFAETTFEFLNRVPGDFWQRVRDLVEEWFARLCPGAQDHVRARLRARSDAQFRAGFWELYCHEILLRLGHEVVCEPDLPDVSRRPDFLAIGPAGRFVVEATIVAKSDAQVAADRREAQVLDLIDRLQTANFFLSLVTHSIGPDAPPASRLRADLQRWLEGLDPDDVMEAIAAEGNTFGPSVPTYPWREAGWHVVFRPLPIKPEARGKSGLRPIGMRGPGVGYVIDDTTPIRGAVKEKAGAYGDLGMPYIVAVQTDPFSVDDFAVRNALFGHEQVSMREYSDGRIETTVTRAQDGIWSGPTGVQNRRLSGVLLAEHLRPWSVGNVVPTLWLHPDGEWPVTVDDPPWRTAVPKGEVMAFAAPARPIHEFLGLSPDWPGPGPAFPPD